MRFEIVVATTLAADDPSESGNASPAAPPRPEAGLYVVSAARRPPARELLEVFVDGDNVTARIRETHGVFVLRDLALALVELSRRPRDKATVRFYDEPWEICLERFGATVCVSVYQTGDYPQVSLYDRALPFDEVVRAVQGAIARVLTGHKRRSVAHPQLTAAADQLRNVGHVGLRREIRVPEPVSVVVELDRDAPLSFGVEFAMRDGGPDPRKTDDGEFVQRADLHALLFRGRMRAEVRGRTVDLGDCHPVLVAERLIELARRAFDAWERGLPLHARGDVAGVLVGVRITAAGELALTLGAPCTNGVEPRAVHTFPALGASDLLQATLTFGRGLVRAILRHDGTQSNNLRLRPLRRALREATESLREASQTTSKVNPAPEPYRAFAAEFDEARVRTPSSPPAARLRYAPRWRVVVPGIDLRGTFLCGDRLVVGSATEMWALDRSNGQVLWRSDAIRGTSVMTPGGVARFAADGSMRVYDLSTGETALRTHIARHAGGPVAGAVVHLPSLPKLLIVTEGEHHLVAIDLVTGEPRWRWSWAGARTTSGRLPSVPRMKRAGRLVYFTCGDSALTALDVLNGSVVWRVRDRLRFRTPPTIQNDSLFIVAGGAHGVARLYSIDPCSGRIRWSNEIAPANSPCTVEGAPMVAEHAVAVAVRQKSGLKLAAFERHTGSPVGSQDGGVAASGTSWLAVDNSFVGNGPTGELVAIDATTGDLRWRQVLGPPPLEADVPRRLEPVLRCGALFVPHAEVAVVRPRDGAILGAISPAEIIPDLLRVDERCDVYMAEESGHLMAFGALPRLSLVRT